jgi:hypothetical protein
MTAIKRSIFLSMFLWPVLAGAQENISSPYSYFGIGDIQYVEIGRVAGIASSAISLSGRTFLNASNPASLAALDSNLFVLDLTGSLRSSNLSSGTDMQKAFSANFTGLSAGLHLSDRWSAALALLPYSTVSYNVEYEEYVEGTETLLPTVYNGSGGVTRFSFLNSFRVSENLSLGADMMLLFGNIDRNVTRSSITINRNSSAVRLSFLAGLQYKERISDNLALSVGAVYGHSCDLDFENSLVVMDESGSILMEDMIASSTISVPRSYGAGASLAGRRVVVAADYRYQRWSLIKDRYPGFSFTDTHRFSAGILYHPLRIASGGLLNALEYQAGFAYSTSCITVNSINPVRYEITAGTGIPFRNGSQINLGLSLGRMGTTAEGLVREDYLRVTLGFTMAERMFFKRMYE